MMSRCWYWKRLWHSAQRSAAFHWLANRSHWILDKWSRPPVLVQQKSTVTIQMYCITSLYRLSIKMNAWKRTKSIREKQRWPKICFAPVFMEPAVKMRARVIREVKHSHFEIFILEDIGVDDLICVFFLQVRSFSKATTRRRFYTESSHGAASAQIRNFQEFMRKFRSIVIGLTMPSDDFTWMESLKIEKMIRKCLSSKDVF